MYIKYNYKLKNFSRQFRSRPTVPEQEMWKYLKWQFAEFKFNRQKPLHGLTVLRFTNNEILNHKNHVKGKLSDFFYKK